MHPFFFDLFLKCLFVCLSKKQASWELAAPIEQLRASNIHYDHSDYCCSLFARTSDGSVYLIKVQCARQTGYAAQFLVDR